MHCSVIRLSLYHYQDDHSDSLQVNMTLKNLFKSRGFKWKTVTNEAKTGSRVEILECQNTKFREQINPMTCTLYREGLRREDIHKEPFTFRIQSFVAIGKNVNGGYTPVQMQPEVQSVCGVLNTVLTYKKNNGSVNILEMGKGSKITENQIEAKELIQVIHKADKINNGDFNIPES